MRKLLTSADALATGVLTGHRRQVDPVLAELDAARWLASELELVTRELVVSARRDERRYSRRL
ncbi:hypothetical protein AB0J52_06055 [Spirillospora sp. NPDC049652]